MQYASKFSFLFLSATLIFSACKKDDDATPEWTSGDKNDLVLEFDNVAGDQDLTLNTVQYTNASGEKFNVTTLKYYISNITLKNEDGTTYTVPQDQSYFLVDESVNEGGMVTLPNIPAGNYTSVSYTIGVDSSRSAAIETDNSKAVGPLNFGVGGAGLEMHWPHNGYIHFKMEGTSPAIDSTDMSPNGEYYLHIGFYGSMGTPNNTRKNTLATTGTNLIKVRKNIAPEVHIKADVMKLYTGSYTLKLKENPNMMMASNEITSKVANNFAAMFEVEHVHNDAK